MFSKMFYGIVDALLVVFGFGADVITVTSGSAGQAGSTAAELITYMNARLLEVAEYNTILDQFGDKAPLPSNSSKTIRFVREEKLTVAATPTQLIEGIPPDAQPLTLNQFEATIEQYGFVVRLSDLAEITARHNIIQRTIMILGLQAAETYDQLVFNNLSTGATQTYFPNNKVANSGLTPADVIQYIDLIEMDAVLQGKGARPFEGGEYVFVCAPQVYASLLRDPDFKAAAQFRAPEKIWRGEVGSLGGFRVIRTNSPSFAATTQASPAGSANKVYTSFAIARYAYQITDLQNLRVYIVAPGGQIDPLQQSRKIGWKFAFKTLVTNTTWVTKVSSAGNDSTAN